MPEEDVTAAVTELNSFEAASTENVLWSRYLPAVFLIAAMVLLAAGRRNRRQLLVTAPSRNSSLQRLAYANRLFALPKRLSPAFFSSLPSRTFMIAFAPAPSAQWHRPF
ncbi:hypothetical protein NHF46_05145 [Arthrobacter alpinus]|nr:hypothetical protein [Arthrobacter alpinus]